jgi:error-prone DNA polymerase
VNSPTVQQWLELTTALHGFPRHLSQHVGGFVISRDKLSRLVPIENAAMEDRSVIQWDKDDLESLRLIKVDVLALGMLSALHRALNLLTDKLGSAHPLRLQDIPREDPATYQMIQRADTVGVFQIESRAQMSMLPRLKPQRLYDLVVEVAIVRPGPIVGGMVHPYLKRKRELAGRRDGPTDPSLNKEIYPKEELKAALERTLGVPIFQEQVMQIAIIAAEFTPGEADQLRRAMAAWQKKGGIGHFEERLVGRMVERGYTPEFAKRVFEQAKGFGEYGFPESHAWGFALLAYFSSWIKCHHPDVFLAALLNSQPMGFYGPSQLVQDAQRHGVTVRPVDVANSHWDCTLERPEQALPEATPWYVRLGLNRLSGFNPDAAQRIMTERTRAPFANVEDLARRCALNRQELTALAAGNALAALAGHRRQARWDVAGIQPLPGLLGESRMNETPLVLNPPRESEEIVADYTSLHLTLGRHPLALLRAQLAARRIQTVQQLRQRRDGQRVSACGLVTVRQRPGTASGVMFMTLEDETGSFNVIVWPKLLITQRQALLRSQLLTVHGVWQDREGVQNLVAQRVQDDTPLLGPLASASRDFH